MRLKTAAGTYAPLLAIGIAAVVGGCATQEDAQPDQFGQAPIVEAVYARDTIEAAAAAADPTGATPPGMPDVQVWANLADPHYPNQLGETGAQNAGNVSPFPASFGGIVVEFNTTLDASKWLGTATIDTDLGSYCSIGSDPTKAPFKVVDVDASSRVVLGSICYDPTSPLFRYPNLTFYVGDGTAVDASINPFTCQDFTPAAGDANEAAFIPSHHYAIQFNTALITNASGKLFAAPANDPKWSSGAFQFTTSGFDIMAAGYQDQNNGYFTFLDKPYKGFLKDLPAVGAAAYQQPANNTSFYVYTTLAIAADSHGNPIGNITVTRPDGSVFGASVSLLEPRVLEIDPPLTWEPGQKYTITIPSDLATAGTAPANYTISLGATYNFSAAPGDVSSIAVTPANGAVAQLAYGKQGAQTDQSSFILIDYNVPVANDGMGNLAAPGAVTVTFTAADGTKTQVAGTAQLNAATNNQEIIFVPTDILKHATVYTVTAKNIPLDPTVPNFPAGEKFPDVTSVFTTSTVRTSAFISFDTGKSADRASNQPLTILGDGVEVLFSRPLDTATAVPANVSITEIKADGTAGTVLDPSIVYLQEIPLAQGAPPSPFAYVLFVDYGDASAPALQDYAVKCNQKYQVAFSTNITDADESPEVHLSAEGCKSGDCHDIRSFTTAPFTAAGITFTAATDTTLDTLKVKFNLALDHTIVNPLLEAGTLVKLSDSMGKPVTLTCLDLPADDSATTIVCTTNSPLVPNSSYTATMLVQNTAPLKAAPQVGGFTDLNGAPIQVPTDQASCSFAGSLEKSILTACAVINPRRPSAKVVSSGKLLGQKLATR